MPCNSDYLEPNQRERSSLRVLGFLKECGLKPTAKEYDQCYGNVGALSADVLRLCGFLRTKSGKWLKDNTSLELQVFWRDHQKADDKREREEAESKRLQRVRDRALAKLTAEERAALSVRR